MKPILCHGLMLAVLLAGAPADAQDLTTGIDGIFSWTTPDAPGCVVGVAHQGVVVVERAYGMADLEHEVPLTTAAVFDVGSLTKQFVAAAVLLLVDDGRLSLTDDIRRFIPELPDYGHTITIDHLLTHTSGVRDWVPLQRLSSRDEDALTMILRQRELESVPGEEWSYSNSGYVLLKELVGRITGMPFSAFAQQRLFQPLGMAATTYADDLQADIAGLALAYEKDGDTWRQEVLARNERGDGGALLSTVGDLLVWNEALTGARLGAFVTAKLQEPARLNRGRQLGYARGLFLDGNRGGRVIWHTGSAGGYKTMLCRFPEQGLSVAILSNAGDAATRMAVTRHIFDLFVPEAEVPDAAAGEDGAPAGDADVADVAAVEVADRAGLYFREDSGEPLHLITDGGQLRIAGGPALVGVADDRFRNDEARLGFLSEAEFELRFPTPATCELTTTDGQVIRYRRAEPRAPDAAELAAFAGRFVSQEAQAVLELTPGDGGLAVRLNDSPPFEFAPADRDIFQRRMMFLRFRRDGAGTIVAVDYSNPMLRGLTFERVSAEAGGH